MFKYTTLSVKTLSGSMQYFSDAQIDKTQYLRIRHAVIERVLVGDMNCAKSDVRPFARFENSDSTTFVVHSQLSLNLCRSPPGICVEMDSV